MTAEELINELTKLMNEHGRDLPVTVAIGSCEFTLREPGYAADGPLPNIADIQKQNPRERFVFEAKDDIPDTE